MATKQNPGSVYAPDGSLYITLTDGAGNLASTGGSVTAANPTATAGPTAVNGSASTFMRSDGAPAIQVGSSSQKGIVQVDNTTITASSGVLTTKGWHTLKQVNTQQTIVTGTTSKTNSYSYTLPGGTLGANGRLRITASWSFTGTNGTKGAGIDFGGTLIGGPGAGGLANTTLAYVPVNTQLANRGSASSQIVVGIPATVFNAGQVGVAPTTPAINTAVDQAIDVWVQLSNALDTGQAETILIEYNNDAP